MESRRSVLRGGAVLALAAALPSGTAEATQNGLLATFFRDKSNADLDRTMSHFSRSNATYIDATLGWTMYSWQAVYDAFAQYMPTWPAGTKSYETRVVGDRNSMVVFFTDSAGMFGPNEIRLAGAVDVRGGKIVRWVDYWDGRHFGLGDYRKLRVPDAQYPTDFAESKTGEAAATTRPPSSASPVTRSSRTCRRTSRSSAPRPSATSWPRRARSCPTRHRKPGCGTC
jgi:hypothetical protein